MSRARWIRRALLGGAALGGSGVLALWAIPDMYEARKTQNFEVLAATQQHVATAPLIPREKQVESLAAGQEYDILVIGAGATGCGVALDAVSRGLKTAMVDKLDFSAGTSSRSTKLIHGGVRYLQKAIMGFDVEQYRMVKEALSERANLIDIAPHLAYPLPIMLPVYKWWQVPYYWVGIKAYDLVSGRQILKPSYLLSKSKALELFPMLKKDKLKAALVYYDGQHDDARMALCVALTAARLGATIANYVEVTKLLYRTDADGRRVVCGATVEDRVSGKTFDIHAKCVVNATGPQTDHIRVMDNPEIKRICQPSSGVHIVLPDYYSPAKMGLLDPSTSDGRVIFFLPWQNSTMAGTTDNPCEASDSPQPSETEIQFILQEIRNYLSADVNVRRGDVLSAWSGIRPLVTNPNASDTQSLARNHIIEVAPSGMITIAGGKWTTYRHMAEETVDKAVQLCGLQPTSGCQTQGLLLDGAHGWSPTLFIRLIQDFGLDSATAEHLANTYGDRAIKVARLANITGKRWPVVGKKLHPDYPYIEAEVTYACREYARRAVDVLARRTRLAFLNVPAAEEVLPRVIEIMAHELGWSKAKQKEEHDHVIKFLNLEMGRDLRAQTEQVPINFTKDEINQYIARFKSMDSDNKGYITIHDLRKYFKRVGEQVTEDQLHEILSEVDANKNAQVDMGEFLQLVSVVETRKRRKAELYRDEEEEMMSALKTGAITSSRFAAATERNVALTASLGVDRKGGMDRSGGGL